MVAVKNATRRAWQPREMQLLTEWLIKNYSHTRWQTRVRLGSPHPDLTQGPMTESQERMVGSWRRWADAVVFDGDKVLIVEAAIRPNPGKISQLQLYDQLFSATPEYREHWQKTRELVLLYGVEDPALVTLARKQGIRCVEYVPEWLPQYLSILYPRERRAPLSPEFEKEEETA